MADAIECTQDSFAVLSKSERMNKRLLAATSALVGMLCVTLVWAQGAPIPGAAQPGGAEREFRLPPAPRVTPAPLEIPRPSHQAPAGADGFRFQLERIELVGNSVYTADALLAPHRARLGQEVTLADLYVIADRITTTYRNNGYILSQAIVPAQQIQAGVARIQIIEGFVNEVRLTGDIKGNRSLVEAYAVNIKASRPLTAQVLERHLLLLNDLAGATARAVLTPAESVVGAADLVIEFAHRTASGSIAVDNRGGRVLGPWRGYVDLDLHSLFGRYDKTAVRAVTTFDRRMNYGSIQHEQPVGESGGRVGIMMGYSKAEPRLGEAFGSASLETSNTSGALSYTHPVKRGRSANVYARASVGFHDGATDFIGVPLKEDKLRMVRIGATVDAADALRGVNIVDGEVSRGLDVFGATETGSPNLSREQGRSDFTKATLYAARLQSIAAGWSILAAINGQHAAQGLLASEMFGFGGAQFGRGYDPSELIGDSGVAGKLELRYTNTLPTTPSMTYTAYAFWDAGRVWRRNPINEESSESGTSFGVGLKLDVARNVTGFGELAKPATRNVRAEGDRDARGYVGLAYRF